MSASCCNVLVCFELIVTCSYVLNLLRKNWVCLGWLADVLVPPREPTEYLYDLRALAENISRDRCMHLEVHPTAPPEYLQQCEPEVTNATNSDNICNVGTPATLGVVQVVDVQPQSKENVPSTDAEDVPSTDAETDIGPAWHIPMTQEKSLQDLPSQLDVDWQDSVLPTPMPSLVAVRNLSSELDVVGSTQNVEPPVVLDTFAEVSQIAQEAVMDAAK